MKQLSKILFHFCIAIFICVQIISARGESFDNIKIVIRGAGPGGMAFAFALIENGLDPRSILMVETRPDGNTLSEQTPVRNLWGSRGRVVSLNPDEGRWLRNLGIHLDEFATPIKGIQIALGDQSYLLSNNQGQAGLVKKLLGKIYDSSTSIGDLEVGMRRPLEEMNVRFLFESTASVAFENNELDGNRTQIKITHKGQIETIETPYPLIVASGKKLDGIYFDKPGMIPRVRYSLDTKPSFFQGYNFEVKDPASMGVASVYMDDKGVFTAGIQTSLNRGSITIGLKSGQRDPHFTAIQVERFLRNAGITPIGLSDSGIFEGELSVASELASRHVILIGDAAHSTDPISGEGLNSAIRDALKIAPILIQSGGLRLYDIRRILDQHALESYEISLGMRAVLEWCGNSPERLRLILGAVGKPDTRFGDWTGRALDKVPSLIFNRAKDAIGLPPTADIIHPRHAIRRVR